MKNLFAIALLTFFAACNSSEGEGNVELNQAAPPVQPVATATSPAVSDSNNATVMQPQQTAVALNPAHGLPGHRCDIAVGAPLNAPANTAAPAIQMQPQTQPQTVAPVMPQTPPTSAAGVRLNPPHGQPGHDCSIEVGKPLRQQ